MHVIGRRGWQQVLLMLSLIVGVVTMHSTIACHADNGTAPATHGTAHPTAATSAASTFLGPASEAPDPAPAVEPMTMTASHGGNAHVAMVNEIDATGPSSAPEQDLAPAKTEVMLLAAPLLGLSGLESSQPDAPRSALHDLLHLCLAVLTALLALAAAALLALFVGRATHRDGSPAGGLPVAGPQAPPPTSVRLAQLCVLRN
ncbi:hypothetical protein ACQP04_02720 [Pseudonocardia halophobica]|uniref:hypothetical protein n=1 Tax=Pseudonocardia halophobica TaxID=29401 RepID=UPI003D90969E